MNRRSVKLTVAVAAVVAALVFIRARSTAHLTVKPRLEDDS